MNYEHRKRTFINEQLDYWQGQKKHLNNEGAYDYKLNCNPKGASPVLDKKQKDYIISSLEMELQILNYKNFKKLCQETTTIAYGKLF